MEEKKNNIENSYLTFKIGDEIYASHVNSVLNIIELPTITRVPHSPYYMKGIMNLRGMVLPVVNTKLKLGMHETESTNKTSIVVMDIRIDEEVVHIGMLVDEVNEVLVIDDSQIKPPPSIGSTYKSAFITGIVDIDNKMIMIIDVVKVFSEQELVELSETNETAEA
jgi:purine-binding chemotaxis protein CheW